MALIEYPSTLPGPVSAPIQSAERRLLSQLPGPRNSRPGQRDRIETQQLSFVFTFDETAIFDAWFKDDLSDGGAWFAASWPLPRGGIGVRKFIGALEWSEYFTNVGWRLNATCEVRGLGILPTAHTASVYETAAFYTGPPIQGPTVEAVALIWQAQGVATGGWVGSYLEYEVIDALTTQCRLMLSGGVLKTTNIVQIVVGD